MTTRDEARAALAVIQNRISASRLGRSWARETDTDILAMREAAKALTALLEETEPTVACAHCGRDQTGLIPAHLTGPLWGEMTPVCHPDEGPDCYSLVTVHGEVLGSRRAWEVAWFCEWDDGSGTSRLIHGAEKWGPKGRVFQMRRRVTKPGPWQPVEAPEVAR